jgi:hypothetical protein
VCRHSCRVIRSRPAFRHAVFARAVSRGGANGETALRPNTRSLPRRPVRSRWASNSSRSTDVIGTRRRVRPFVSIRPSFSSQPCSTWITPASKLMLSTVSACNSPRRRPAYIAVAHTARSRSGTAASRRATSSGSAIRSREARSVGSSRPPVGFTARRPPETSRRKIARSGLIAPRIVLAASPAATSSSTRSWTSARVIADSFRGPSTGSTCALNFAA